MDVFLGGHMDSGMVSKVEKARRYAEETERVRFGQFEVAFTGDHNTYSVSYDRGTWQCTCRFFARRRVCSHTMAMERILGDMVAQDETANEVTEESTAS
jgi:hypothetical protein